MALVFISRAASGVDGSQGLYRWTKLVQFEDGEVGKAVLSSSARFSSRKSNSSVDDLLEDGEVVSCERWKSHVDEAETMCCSLERRINEPNELSLVSRVF